MTSGFWPPADVDFYKAALTYDRNSNILSADDSVHAGFDIKHTMDNLNRLTTADEGTLSGGSITSRTRKQEWTLTQTGNWSRDRVNLNDDTDWTDPGEWDDTKTFNMVNEIGTRDLHTTGSTVTLAYDPAGNLTNDAIDYKYEWDPFYRLRKVKTQGGALVAEYRYDGLGYRIGVLEDVNGSGTVDSSDSWYYSAYDEIWRVVATYRSADPINNPKERFVYQQAGADGYGGSSYIDLVAFRERDMTNGWTGAPDGNLEEKTYYCQNQHADVVALITVAGGQREMDRYSAYGVPFGLPVGDCDSDGDCDSADVAIITSWRQSSHYDVRGDVDLDGDVDPTDKSTVQNNHQGVTLGRGVLSSSAVGNLRAGGGIGISRSVSCGLSFNRRREFVNSLGSWSAREPLGQFPPTDLYQYCYASPNRFVDPTGREPVTVGDGGSDFGAGLMHLMGANPDEEDLVRNGEISPYEAARANGIARDTVEDVYTPENLDKMPKDKKTGAPKPDGTWLNALLHCRLACRLTINMGPRKAAKILGAHETGDPNNKDLKGQIRSKMDRRNNYQGIDCGEKVAAWHVGLDRCGLSCEDCCNCKFRAGLLSVLSADQLYLIQTTGVTNSFTAVTIVGLSNNN